MVVQAQGLRSTGPRARTGLLVAGAAATPFIAGALLYEPSGADLGGPAIACPFRVATGLPCPLCGSTRAIVLAGHGDLGFVDYNAVAVVVLAAAIVLGLAAVAGRRAAALLSCLAAAPVRPLLVLAVVAWAWTLTHRGTITS